MEYPIFFGRGERTQTFDLPVPNRARYQLRHTPILVIMYAYLGKRAARAADLLRATAR